ncbi:MAG TPA: glycosyltransferase 87 family protein [Acetobacteraceae bacterium]|nr:glycosyltransferase 87 family protein [Acetobacteraceae bacterium]
MTAGRRLAFAAMLGAVAIVIMAAQAGLWFGGEGVVDGHTLLLRFVALWAVAGACYLGAVALLMEVEGHGAVMLVLAVAAALRVVPFAMPPFLSTDVYRYVWDGRVQNAGINPYRYIPDAPELSSLRDEAIFERMNRPDYAPTIYPPAAQMVFAAVARVSETVRAMKVAVILAEVVGIAAMLALLRRAGLPAGRVAIYAWNPVFAWEYAGNGHVDALVVAFVGLALLAAVGRRAALAGVALAAAVLTKFVPVVLAPALWRPRERGSRWRFPPAAVIAVGAAYACYASVGVRVLGFLGGYSGEEGLTSGRGIYPLQWLRLAIGLPGWAGVAWLACAAIVLAALGLFVVTGRRAGTDAAGLGRDALLLAIAATVAISPHYAWYYGWLAYLCCLAPWPSVIFLSVACLGCYIDADHTNFGWATAVTGAFAVLAVRDLWRGARSGAALARST